MLSLWHLKWHHLGVTPCAVTVMPGTLLKSGTLTKYQTSEMGNNKRETAILNVSLINWVKEIPFYFWQSMGLKDDEDNDYIWMQQILNINPDDALSDNLRKNSCFFF